MAPEQLTIGENTTIKASGIIRMTKQYAVTITKPSLGVYGGVYLSATSATATVGSPSGTTYNYDTTVYGFAKVSVSDINAYTYPSTWVQVAKDGSYYYYRVGSVKVKASNNSISLGTISPKEFTVTFNANDCST